MSQLRKSPSTRTPQQGSPQLEPADGDLPPPPPMIHLQGNGTAAIGATTGLTPRSQGGNSASARKSALKKASGGSPGTGGDDENSPSKLDTSSRRTKRLDLTAPSSPPTRHLVVDHEILQKEIDGLHDDIFSCEDVPASLREECTDLLQDINKFLTLDHIRFTEKEAKMEARSGMKNDSFTSNPGTGAPTQQLQQGLSTPGRYGSGQESARSGGADSAGSPIVRPLQQPWGKVNNAKLARSWDALVRKASKRMSVEEIALLSLPTIRELMHYYSLDRDPIEIANVELYWRALAQQREDERNKKALPHKKCAATPKNPKAATREISKQMSGTKVHQAPTAGGGGSVATGSMAGSFRASPQSNMGGSFRR